MNIWLILIITGLITYAIRLSFILFFGNREIPPRLQTFLRFVPAAVLPALVFPDVLLRDGALVLSPLNFRLVAALLAVLAAWRTRNTLLTIVTGMASLWVLQALVH
ncbi:MAG TPA: AzlD domain-containing protein [Anaerolineaceae bacterium]|nr:AzlD domain-containing protein [Anaerolineaceae bacterium]